MVEEGELGDNLDGLDGLVPGLGILDMSGFGNLVVGFGNLGKYFGKMEVGFGKLEGEVGNWFGCLRNWGKYFSIEGVGFDE